jgi:hypothetical protein
MCNVINVEKIVAKVFATHILLKQKCSSFWQEKNNSERWKTQRDTQTTQNPNGVLHIKPP